MINIYCLQFEWLSKTGEYYILQTQIIRKDTVPKEHAQALQNHITFAQMAILAFTSHEISPFQLGETIRKIIKQVLIIMWKIYTL